MFCGVGAKNIRCFDDRIVGGVIQYNTSYAVVDCKTVKDAGIAFKFFKGRNAYPGSYHLRLKFVDVNDQTFDRRMAASTVPMERSGEREGFAEFVENTDGVNADLAKVILPGRSDSLFSFVPLLFPSGGTFHPFHHYIQIPYH